MFTSPPRLYPRHRDTSPDSARRRGGRSRGQSVTEFALLLPVMLAFLGLTIDFARVFQSWITLQSATRDAAEASATNSKTSANALTVAQKTVCLQAQNVSGFQRSGLSSPNDVEQCSSPTVTIVSYDLSETAAGASHDYPIGTVTVRASVPFRPLFAYPFLTQNGTWTVITEATFSVAQNRE
jgi:Flp pilus assembly protein TadG